MNVLITGVTGFTARHLIDRLRLEDDVVLHGVDLQSEPPISLDVDDYCAVDLTDLRQVTRLIRGVRPDWIFNLAGLARGAGPDLYRVNLLGAVNVLESVRIDAPDAAILLVGSAAEYGFWPVEEMPLTESHECRPLGSYGLSKHAMTRAAQDYARRDGVKAVVTRPFNLVGAGMPANLVAGAIAHRVRSALASNESRIVVGNADTQRDFVAVEDAVDGYVRLLQSGRWGEVFNICSGQAHSIREIVEVLLSWAPRPFQVVEDEALMRADDPPVVVGDPTKASQVCDFRPRVDFHDALRAAWNEVMGGEIPEAVSAV